MNKAILLLLFICVCFLTSNAQTVQYYLTEGDESSLIAQQAQLNFVNNPDGANATINVDASQKYQSIDALGFALTQGSAEVINGLSPSVKSDLLNELFGPDGLNISGVRISIGASDLSNSVYTYNETSGDVNMTNFSLAGPDLDHVVPLIQEILIINPSLKVLASPWTAPTWMKTNNDWKGGSLDPAFYGAYALYFVRYIQEMSANGIDIWAITPQNEPENPFNTPSMVMTYQEQIEFIENHLGPALTQANINSKIIAFDHNVDNPNYPIQVLNNTSFTDGAAFHLYVSDGADIANISTVYNNTGKNMYFTEQYTDIEGSFSGDLNWHSKYVVIGSLNNWCKTVFEWNLATDIDYGPRTDGGCNECLGAITVLNANSFERNVSYYIIGQISKFVNPGAERISSNSNRNYMYNTAVQNPNGDITLVVFNDRRNAQTIQVNFGGKGFNATIPKFSAASFVWTPDSGQSTLSAPNNLEAATLDSASIQLTWNDNANNETAFELQRSLASNSGWTTIANLGSNATQYGDTGLAANTTYYYRVRAINSTENSDWSNIAFATTDQGAGNSGGSLKNIKAKHSGKGLDVQDVSTRNSANIQQWEINGLGLNQVWELLPNNDGSFGIKVQHSGKCLSILRSNNPNVVQKNCGSAEATWILEEVETGYHRITNASNNLALTAEGGSVDNGANVTTASYFDADHQKWEIVDALLLSRDYEEYSTIPKFMKDDKSVISAFDLFPNPAFDQLLINKNAFTQEDYQIEIFNMLGERVFLEIRTGSDVPIDISFLSPGSYTVKISQYNREVVKKLLKIKG